VMPILLTLNLRAVAMPHDVTYITRTRERLNGGDDAPLDGAETELHRQGRPALVLKPELDFLRGAMLPQERQALAVALAKDVTSIDVFVYDTRLKDVLSSFTGAPTIEALDPDIKASFVGVRVHSERTVFRLHLLVLTSDLPVLLDPSKRIS